MKRGNYHVTIIENDGTVMDCYKIKRKDALQETNAAEKVRHCKAWRITYVKQIKSKQNEQK